MPKELIAINLTINPTMIVALPEYHYTDKYGDPVDKLRSYTKAMTDAANLQKKRVTNKLSKQSRKKINNVINWMAIASHPKKVFSKKTGKGHKWRLNFATFTIQAGWHQGSELFRPAYDPIYLKKETPVRMHDLDCALFQKKLVNPLLTYLKKYHQLKNYVWKMERTKNDTLHLHLTTDTFMPWQLLRNSWNRILQNNGLLDRYYQAKGHYDANSTDIHAQKRNIENMAAYIIKEMVGSKYLGRFISGRLWGCNWGLTRACNQKLTFFLQNGEGKELRAMELYIKEQRDIETKPDELGKFMTIGRCFFPTPREWLNNKLGAVKDKFVNTIMELRNGVLEQQLLFN